MVPRPGERVDVLAPPPLRDWWTAVGSVTDTADGGATAGAGSSVLARSLARLTALLPKH